MLEILAGMPGASIPASIPSHGVDLLSNGHLPSGGGQGPSLFSAWGSRILLHLAVLLAIARSSFFTSHHHNVTRLRCAL